MIVLPKYVPTIMTRLGHSSYDYRRINWSLLFLLESLARCQWQCVGMPHKSKDASGIFSPLRKCFITVKWNFKSKKVYLLLHSLILTWLFKFLLAFFQFYLNVCTPIMSSLTKGSLHHFCTWSFPHRLQISVINSVGSSVKSPYLPSLHHRLNDLGHLKVSVPQRVALRS